MGDIMAFSRAFNVAMVVVVLVVSLVGLQLASQGVEAAGHIPPHGTMNFLVEEGRELSLFTPPPLILNYHGGPLLSASTGIPLYLIWYGSFSVKEQLAVVEFLSSISPTKKQAQGQLGTPTVSTWWKTLTTYKDKLKKGVSPIVTVAGQYHYTTPLPYGKQLTAAEIENIVTNSLEQHFPKANSDAVFLVLTAYNIAVDGFCEASCGSHAFVTTKSKANVPYVWVGNPVTQCPGQCAWPYAAPLYGPPDFTPLVSPNGVGADGLVINIAIVLAGTVTNPFDTGYYQGVASEPSEAATACPGIFGPDAYPGYAGQLETNPRSKASFNAYGIHGSLFLLPALWNPGSQSCQAL